MPEMNRALARASGIITNLMDFARGRLGAGIEVVAPHPVQLEPVFRGIISEIAQITAHPVEASINLPRPIRALLMSMLAKDPKNRPANAIKLAEAAEAAEPRGRPDRDERLDVLSGLRLVSHEAP